jgi:hypothetical protein
MQKRKTMKELGKKRLYLEVDARLWAKVYIASSQGKKNMAKYCIIAIEVSLARDVSEVSDSEIDNILRKPRVFRVI